MQYPYTTQKGYIVHVNNVECRIYLCNTLIIRIGYIYIKIKRYKKVQLYVYGFYKTVGRSEMLMRAQNFNNF